MDAPLQCLQKYIYLRDKLQNDSLQSDPNFLWVLLKGGETVIVQMVQAHDKSREEETGPHNFASCVICQNKEALEYLINNRISLPPIPEAGPFNGVVPSLCDQNSLDLPHDSSKSSGQEDEEPEGDDVVFPEQKPTTCCNLDDHTREIRKKFKAHKEFMDDNKKKIIEERCKHRSEKEPLNVVLTYYDTNNKIIHRLCNDEQEARSWAYDNVNLMAKHFPFILTWRVGRLKSPPLKANDLAIFKAELIHPVDSSTVIKEKFYYDTGGDTGSFPYKPQIPEKFINSATTVNGNVVPTVLAELRINGRKLTKIHEVELDSDNVACLGNPEVAEMRDRDVRNMMKEKTKVIINKKNRRS